MPINDPFGGWVQWSRLAPLGIEQIEVMRGGGSALWGNGALGGVINVLPRHPTRSEEHTSELQSHLNLVCRLLLEKKKNIAKAPPMTLDVMQRKFRDIRHWTLKAASVVISCVKYEPDKSL